MNITLIIQARMGSTRLPNKVLMMLDDKTVLGHVINRCKLIPSVTKIVVATTTLEQDDAICNEAIDEGVAYFRGSEHNVLERYYSAAKTIPSDYIVRITSDCPLLDPNIVEDLIQLCIQGQYDYSRVSLDCFPRGLDAEILTFNALEKSMRESTTDFEKEHVTQYILQHSEMFKIGLLKNWELCDPMDSNYRLTLDTEADWELIKEIYRNLYQKNEMFYWPDVKALLKQQPMLAEINAAVEQKHPTT